MYKGIKDLSINFFTSTRGHYGYKDVYKKTIESLSKKFINFYDIRKYANIKISPGEDQLSKEIRLFLISHGFQVLCTFGDWNHKDMSAQIGRLEDIYSLNAYMKADSGPKYGFNLEDDWIFNSEDLTEEFEKALIFLDRNPSFINYRWSRVDDVDVVNRLNLSEFSYRFEKGIYSSNREYSFNPHFCRNEEQYFISRYCLTHLPCLLYTSDAADEAYDV